MKGTGERRWLRVSLGGMGRRTGSREAGRKWSEGRGLSEVTKCLGREWVAGREGRVQREGGRRFPRRKALGDDVTI